MQQWLMVAQAAGALLAFVTGVINLTTAIVGRRKQLRQRRTR